MVNNLETEARAWWEMFCWFWSNGRAPIEFNCRYNITMPNPETMLPIMQSINKKDFPLPLIMTKKASNITYEEMAIWTAQCMIRIKEDRNNGHITINK